MALQLTFDSPYSAAPVTAYLRITDVQANFVRETALVEVSVYEDQAAREAGKEPIGRRTLSLTPADAPTFAQVLASLKTTDATPPGTLVFDMVKAGLYQLLKTRPGYEGAVDV